MNLTFLFHAQIGVIGASIQGDVAIDDVLLSAKTCPVAGNCDFENGNFDLCSYLNQQNNDFDWELYSPALANNFNGQLIYDHTLNNDLGRFMVANGQKKGSVGTVFSAKLDPTSLSGSCLSFYFYFSGSSDYNLTVSIIDLNGSAKTLWGLRDSQVTRGKWLLGQFKYYSEEEYRIHFVGVAGTGKKNFIGVDDIEILSGDRACSGMPTVAILGEDMPASTVAPATTTAQPTIEEFDCDFEGPCNWRNGPESKVYSWQVARAGGEPKAPTIDHTFQEIGQGSFLAVTTTNATAKKSKATFISPFLNSSISSYKCIEFYYYLYGSEVSKLFSLIRCAKRE